MKKAIFIHNSGGRLAVDLSQPEGRNRLGQWIGQTVDQALDAKDLLHRRWAVLEAMFRNEPGSSGFRLMKRVEVHPAPLITPRVKRISNTVFAQILAPDPWVQCIPDQWQAARAGSVEQGLHGMAERSGLRELLRDALDITGCCGLSIIRRRFVSGKGIEDELIHPADFVISPTYQTTLAEAQLAGHRFYLPVWRVREQMRLGVFYPHSALTADSQVEPSGHNPGFTGGAESQQSEDQEYRQVELWEVIVVLETDQGPQRFRAVLTGEDHALMLIEPYPYDRPWYFDLRFHREYGVWWNANSVANQLQGLQHDYTTLHALLTQGTLVAALPPMVVSGGFLTERLKSYEFADVIETDVPIQAQSLPISFRPETIPLLIEQIERLADALTGVSQLGITQELRAGTTATEVNTLAAIQKQAENSYLSFASQTFGDLWRFALDLAQHHAVSFRHVYGRLLPREFWEALEPPTNYRFVVTGESGSEVPAVQMQSLQTLLAMSQVPGSGLDYRAVEKAVVNALPIRLLTETLFRNEEQPPTSTPGDRPRIDPRMAGEAGRDRLSEMVPGSGADGDSLDAPEPTEP